MTATDRRLTVALLTIRIYSVPTRAKMAILRLLFNPLSRVIGHYAKNMQHQRDTEMVRGSILLRRVNELTDEIRRSDRVSEERKSQLKAAGSSLLKDVEAWQAGRLTISIPWAMKAMQPIVSHMHAGCSRRARKLQSFAELVARYESEAFYFDLFLWLVLPVAFSDALLGDLNEELLLKIEALGRERARAWYRKQVITTFRACMWDKLGRLAIIATLIDQFHEWRRK